MTNHRRIITLLGIGTAISLLGDATLYTVLPHPAVAAEAGVSLAMVGVLLGTNRAVRLLLNGMVGVLYDRMYRRALLVASLAIGSIASVFYALGSGFWPLFAGRAIWGLAWSLLWIGGNAVILDISTDENRGRFSGAYQMWFFVGIGLASFLGGLFTDLFGFRSGQWISALLIGLAALLWLILLPETRQKEIAGKDSRSQPAGVVLIPWRLVLAASAPVFVARFITWGVVAATAILWLSSLMGESLEVFGWFIPIATLTGTYTALSMVAGVSSAPAAGSLSDRLGRRWPVVALSLLLGGAGIWLMSIPFAPVALMGALLAQMVSGGVETLVPAIIGDRVNGRSRGRSLGLIYTFGDLGATLGPVVALGILNRNWLTVGEIYKAAALLLVLVGIFAVTQTRR
ncbi:MAG: MFS transporter [Chloroflexi bacterium]|nr:MFS transporter [Chloroflexota bacterium]